MTRKQRRAGFIAAGVGILSVAVFLVMFVLRDTIVFFHTPKDVVEKRLAPGQRIADLHRDIPRKRRAHVLP